jgi:hypothetical protein
VDYGVVDSFGGPLGLKVEDLVVILKDVLD